MIVETRYLVSALVLHTLLFGLLAGGVQCTRKVTGSPVIHATLIAAQHKLPEPKKPVEERRKPEPPPPKEKPQPDRRLEEEKRKQSELVAKKAEELKKKELEQKRLAEEERKRKLEEERREDQRKELTQQAAAEEAQREIQKEAQVQNRAAMDAKTAAWQAALERYIRKNWTRPVAVTQDFQCTVHVQLLPDGTVSTVKVEKSCGTTVLDKSVEDAVRRSSPLPRPDDPSVFDRDLIINFQPET